MNIKPGVLGTNIHPSWNWFWNNVTFSVPFIAGDAREIITGTHTSFDDRPSIIRPEGIQKDFTATGRIRFNNLPKFAYDWTLKNGLFTILIDLEPTETPSIGGDGVLTTRRDTDSLGEWQVYADDAGGGAWMVRFPTVGQIIWQGSMIVNTPNRAVLVRKPGGIWRVYNNGVDYGTNTESTELTTTIPQEDIAIGSRTTHATNTSFKGYISSVHILNGYAATHTEARQFSMDPYGMLRQANRLFLPDLPRSFGSVVVPSDIQRQPITVQSTGPTDVNISQQPELITNGGFDTDTAWDKGAGWSISAGVASAAATTSNLGQAVSGGLKPGRSYLVTYTLVNYTGGTVRVDLRGNVGSTRSTNGTYVEVITVTSYLEVDDVRFVGLTAFTGDIDNVSVREVNIKITP